MYLCIIMHSFINFLFLIKDRRTYINFFVNIRGMGSIVRRTHGYKFKKPDLESLRKLAKMLTSLDIFENGMDICSVFSRRRWTKGSLTLGSSSTIRFTAALLSRTISWPLHWRNILTGSVYPCSTRYPSMVLNSVLKSQTLQSPFTLRSLT